MLRNVGWVTDLPPPPPPKKKTTQSSCTAVSNKRVELNISSLKNFISNVENMECIIYSQQLCTILHSIKIMDSIHIQVWPVYSKG